MSFIPRMCCLWKKTKLKGGNLQWCLLLTVQNGKVHRIQQGAEWSGNQRTLAFAWKRFFCLVLVFFKLEKNSSRMAFTTWAIIVNHHDFYLVVNFTFVNCLPGWVWNALSTEWIINYRTWSTRFHATFPRVVILQRKWFII